MIELVYYPPLLNAVSCMLCYILLMINNKLDDLFQRHIDPRQSIRNIIPVYLGGKGGVFNFSIHFLHPYLHSEWAV